MCPMEMEWEMIYELYANDVNSFLLSILDNQTDVDDLRQETFIKAFCYFDTLIKSASTKTWLLSIAHNLAIDKLRKEKRLKDLLPLLSSDTKSAPPEDFVCKNERSLLIRHAIYSLPLPYRLVVSLRGIQDLSPTETALILDWSVNKVNVYYHRALKKLRRLLEEEELYNALISC